VKEKSVDGGGGGLSTFLMPLSAAVTDAEEEDARPTCSQQ
jgi:hypothetical protein